MRLLATKEAILAPAELAGAVSIFDAPHLVCAARVDIVCAVSAIVVGACSGRCGQQEHYGGCGALHGSHLCVHHVAGEYCLAAELELNEVGGARSSAGARVA